MNYYSISNEMPLSNDDFKALLLLYLTSDDFDIFQNPDGTTIFSGSLSYSLSNLQTTQLKQLIYSSEFQKTVEKFDKPLVDVSDIVLSVGIKGETSYLSKYYDEFIRFDVDFPSSKDGESLVIFIGTSNSSKSNYNDPFNENVLTIITSQNQLGNLLVNTQI